jgi:nitrogen regulatory protein PII-like uncharacterized protein
VNLGAMVNELKGLGIHTFYVRRFTGLQRR